MDYVIKAPAVANGVITLQHVADAMAKGIAMAGGTPFHEPTYSGRFKRYAQWLLDDAKEGRLVVCDGFGRPSSVDELRADDANVVVLESFDPDNPDTSPVDEFATLLLAVCTREKWLNDWAATNGETFAIDHAGVAWIDERGDVIPPVQVTTKPVGQAPVMPAPASEPIAAGDTAWPLKRPQRDDGLATPIYRVLKAAHDAKAPRPPNAREVLEAFRTTKPTEIVRVLADGCDFFNKMGEASADLKGISKRIGEMTTVRCQRRRASAG